MMMKNVITTNLHVAAIASVSLLVLPYSAMFVTNNVDVIIPLFAFLAFLLKSGVVFAAVIFIVISLAGKKYHLLVIDSLFFLVLATAIQYYFLSESINVLDGQNLNTYSAGQITVDLIIYVLVGGLIYAFKNKVHENIRMLGTGVCLFQLINLGVLIQSHDDIFDDVSKLTVDVSALSNFSGEENVLHIVFDGFQSGLFQDIVENDSKIASGLDGFLYFPDALTGSEVTQLSFAAFLTGREYTNNEPMKTYLFNSRLARMGTAKPIQHVPNILEAAANADFQVEVATPFILLEDQEFYSQFFFIQRPYDSEINLRKVINYQTGFVFDLTLFRSVPKILKEFVYNEGRWRLSGLYTSNQGLGFNHHASVEFLGDVTNRFMLSEQPRVYKFFHLVTPHAPFVTNSNCGFSGKELNREYMNIYNQARCALIQLVKLLDKFKSSGIYDSATILVHGDHGIRLPFADFETDPDDDTREFPHPIGNSNPLLLIKPPGGRGNPVTVSAEISLSDIPKTMSELLQLDDDFDGVDFLNEKPINRSRRYYHSQQSRVVAGRDDRFLQWNEYEVSGPVTKKSSWSKVGENNWTKKNFVEFPVAEFLEIEQVDLIGKKEVRVRYRDRERHHFIAVGPQKRVTRFVGTDTIKANLRSRSDIEQVCIVDTVRELRQCLY